MTTELSCNVCSVSLTTCLENLYDSTSSSVTSLITSSKKYSLNKRSQRHLISWCQAGWWWTPTAAGTERSLAVLQTTTKWHKTRRTSTERHKMSPNFTRLDQTPRKKGHKAPQNTLQKIPQQNSNGNRSRPCTALHRLVLLLLSVSGLWSPKLQWCQQCERLSH